MRICTCGCGIEISDVDNYGRVHSYVPGHNGRKYQDPTQYKREWNKRNSVSRTTYRRETRWIRKIELIIYLGGKCMKCKLEYNGKNGCLFDFHHRDPKEKEYGISGNVMEKSLIKLKKEADKCNLLCGNCHRPIHSAEY